MPGRKGLELAAMTEGCAGREVGIGVLPGLERADQPAAALAVDVVIAGDDEESPTLQPEHPEQVVEETRRRYVLRRSSGVGNVPGREDDLGRPAVVAIARQRGKERTEHDIAVVGVASAKMEIRDVQPGELHHPSTGAASALA